MNKYGDSFDSFLDNDDLQDIVSFNLFQIGELSNCFSDEFKNQTKDRMPWKAIIATRNRIAHGYLSIDYQMIWRSAFNDIPELHNFCVEMLKNNQSPDVENITSASVTAITTTETPSSTKLKP
jgi:uncharacterized protein with HEPN domain